ncbi:2-hydroxyacid dehydrogenase [Roseisalinus antarcticus]|uniref:D-3-phosphoglycerate dehydrogenase n=1 Tax=Roseisalinus antarcticus TaxID=254357 RepID=A0A1Y5TVK6_9RHOB|nr:hydroxyacid dehydrogenase [Roseisalinus antarcticus]SLN74292.1 D-3-phosphoglycerate dehydrogenase [Roseisalinus antarcticus]
MRIVVISDSLTTLPKAVGRLETSGHAVTYVNGLIPFPRIAAEGLAPLDEADAIVMGRVMETDAAALDLVPNARVIALHTSGTDNVDIDAASERGIQVTNVKGVNAAQCAEFSIGLMLAITRQIAAGDAAIRAGRWAAGTDNSMDVFGATLGLVGLGQIGREAARRAKAFGMRLICHTRTPDEALARELGIEYMPLDQLLAEADVVSLYASLSDQTRGMIGAAEIARMRPSAYLVNIARGELIDEAALTDALKANRIAGAALDVFQTEPLTESPLFGLPNTVLTPHMAGLTRNAKSDAAVLAVRNALAVLAGDEALNPVNSPADRPRRQHA